MTTTPFIPSHLITNAHLRTASTLSPNGLFVAFVQGEEDGVSLWVAPIAAPSHTRRLLAPRRRIEQYVWSHDSSDLVYVENQEKGCNLLALSLADGTQRSIATLTGSNGKVEQLNALFADTSRPRELLVSVYVGDLVYQDWYVVDIGTGESRCLVSNSQLNRLFCDEHLVPRVATKVLANGDLLLLRSANDGWETFKHVPLVDEMTTEPVCLDRSGQYFYFVDSHLRDAGALVVYDTHTRETRVLLADPKADVCKWSQAPTTGKVELAAADYERRRWAAIDPAAEPDLEFLNTALSGDLDILSRSADDRIWLVREVPNDAPARCHAYLRDESQLVPLFSDRESLLQFPLSPRIPYVLGARDGLQLVSYLTLPPGTPCQPNGRPESPLPFILYVHGGPTLRDDWGYGFLHQWLANRGYAVLCVNFRGSAGFGKSFRAAGNQQWGRAMQDDLMDAVQWAVDGGIADAEKLAIMGASYGGYTTFAALGLVPEYFACGVSMVSPMDLVAMLQSIPQHWTPFIEQVLMEVGDYRTPEGQIDLRSRSPVTFAKQIQRPMLIVQGGLEPPERLTLSLQVARELESRGVRVIYVVFPDEGHVFESPKNLAALVAITDWFLAFTLGGRTEDTLEAAMSRSSARVEVGSNWLLPQEAES